MPNRIFALAGLGILLAQFSINIGAAVGKSLYPQVGPEGIAALRTLFAAAILLPIARPWQRMPTFRQLRILLVYGLAVGGMNLLIYWAFERIPIGVAVAIEVTGPLAVVLVAARSARDFLWFALAVIGLMLLVPWPGFISGLDPVGIAFALGAAACWALYIVIGRHASQVSGATAVAIGMAAACLVTVPAGITKAGAGLLQGHVLAIGLTVAVLSSAFPYMLEMKAFGRLPNRLFGTATSAAPAIAALCGFLVLGERLTIPQWIAVLLMIGASAGSSLTARPVICGQKDEALV